MVRRKSYLTKLTSIFLNLNHSLLFFKIIYLTQMLFLPIYLYSFTKLIRLRLNKRRRRSQFLYYNRILFFWLLSYRIAKKHYRQQFLHSAMSVLFLTPLLSLFSTLLQTTTQTPLLGSFSRIAGPSSAFSALTLFQPVRLEHLTAIFQIPHYYAPFWVQILHGRHFGNFFLLFSQTRVNIFHQIWLRVVLAVYVEFYKQFIFFLQK